MPGPEDWEYVETPHGMPVPLMALEDTETDPSTNKARHSILILNTHDVPVQPVGWLTCEWLVMQVLTSSSHSIASFFTADDWEYHQSAARYFRNLFNITESTVYRRILSPCIIVTAFSALVATHNSVVCQRKCTHLTATFCIERVQAHCQIHSGLMTLWASHACPTLMLCHAAIALALGPHTLLGSALSLLLVFRTNASYGRLVEGRRVQPLTSHLMAITLLCHSTIFVCLKRVPYQQGDRYNCLAEFDKMTTCIAKEFGRWHRQAAQVSRYVGADVGSSSSQCKGVGAIDDSVLPRAAAAGGSGLYPGQTHPSQAFRLGVLYLSLIGKGFTYPGQ